MNDLLDLFQRSFSSTSHEEVAAAGAEIQSRFPSQEFYQACILIILDSQNQIPITLKQSALINFTNGIRACWKEVFDPNTKLFILNQIPTLLARVPFELLRYSEKLSDIIIDENIQYFIEVLPQLFSQDINFLKAGLILSKSICKKIKNPTPKLLQNFQDFSFMIFPVLSNVCQNIDDLLCLNFLYHCLYRLLYNPSNREDLLSITDKLFQIHGAAFYFKFMALSASIPNPINLQYLGFLKEGIKFLTSIISKLNDEQITQIFSLLQAVFSLPISKESNIVKTKAIFFLNSIIIDQKRIDILESNMQFIIGNLFSNMVLSNSDIENMENDPYYFTQDNKQSDPNWDDLKASSFRFISNCVKESSSLIDFIFQFSISILQHPESRNQIFSVLQLLCSAVVTKKSSEYFNQFLPMLAQAANSEDYVIRAGTFLVLYHTECPVPPEVIETCFSHLTDPFLIVSYYSALAFSHILELVERTPLYTEVKAHFSPRISSIYESLFLISSNLNDNYITHALNSFTFFFNEQVLPFAIQIFDKMMDSFIYACTTDPSFDSQLGQIESTSFDGLKAIIKVLDNVKQIGFDALAPYYGHFYARLTAALGAVANSTNIDDLFFLFSMLINQSPVFNPTFWGLLHPLQSFVANSPNADIDEIIPIVEQLIFKDVELASRGQIVGELCNMLMSMESVLSSPMLAASLIMRLGPNLPCIGDIVACLQSFDLVDGDFECFMALSNIVSAVFLTFSDFAPLFPDGNFRLIDAWIENRSFPLFVASSLKIFAFFDKNPPLQAKIIEADFKCLVEDDDLDDIVVQSDDGENDELFDDFQVQPGDMNLSSSFNPQWFNDVQLAKQLLALCSNLMQKNSQVVEIIGHDKFSMFCNVLNAYPNHKNMMKQIDFLDDEDEE